MKTVLLKVCFLTRLCILTRRYKFFTFVSLLPKASLGHSSWCSVNGCGNEQVKVSWLQRTPLVTMSLMHFKHPMLCPDLVWKPLSGKFLGEHCIRISFVAFSSSSTLILRTFYLGPYWRVFLLGPLSRWSTPQWPVSIPSTENGGSHTWGWLGKAVHLPCVSTLLQSHD